MGATLEDQENVHAANSGGASVWWKFVSPASGSITIDTQGSAPDTLLAVYQGSTVDQLSPRAENDDADADSAGPDLGVQSRVDLNVAAGQTYEVAVDGFRPSDQDPEAGPITLHLSLVSQPVTPPANDAFSSAASLAVVDGAVTSAFGTSWGATKQAGEPNHAGSSGGSSVWWQVTAPSNGTLELATRGSGYDTLLAVYTGASVNALTAVPNAFNDDEDFSHDLYTSSVAPFPVTAGTTYRIAVDGFAGTQGQVKLQARFVAADFVSMTPARLMDTRPGAATVDGLAAGTGALGAGATRDLVVTGRAGVPSSGVGAVVVNVTVTQPSAGGFVTVFPAGTARPNASNLNFLAGQTTANLVVAKVGASGQISLFNLAGTTHVIVDIVGWFPSTADFASMTPARLMDTRPGAATVDGLAAGTGALGAGATRDLVVTGRAGVPSSGVGAVVVNVTVTQPSAGGFVTVFPAGTARPNASNLNFLAGQTTANLVVAKVGASGQISLFNLAGTTHVIVDIVGWFPSTADFASMTPARLMDTRPGAATVDGLAAGTGALGAGATRDLVVTGRAGVPSSGVGAVVVNVTVTQPSAGGFVTVFPAGTARPNASNLNFLAGQTTANLVVAKVGASGQISLFNLAGTTHVIVDIVGWFPT